MKLFSTLYNWMIHWSKHRHAPYYLFILSFAESSFFPIPPDVMLAPMALARPEKAWSYATLTTVSSVLGGVFGYFIGMFFFHLVHPIIIQVGYEPMYQQIVLWFKSWGFLIVLIAGFAPIPYKLFTIGAGAMAMPMLPFVLASTLSRGGRFFLVCGLIRLLGPKIEQVLQKYIDRMGWGLLMLLILAYLIIRL